MCPAVDGEREAPQRVVAGGPQSTSQRKSSPHHLDLREPHPAQPLTWGGGFSFSPGHPIIHESVQWRGQRHALGPHIHSNSVI